MNAIRWSALPMPEIQDDPPKRFLAPEDVAQEIRKRTNAERLKAGWRCINERAFEQIAPFIPEECRAVDSFSITHIWWQSPWDRLTAYDLFHWAQGAYGTGHFCVPGKRGNLRGARSTYDVLAWILAKTEGEAIGILALDSMR